MSFSENGNIRSGTNCRPSVKSTTLKVAFYCRVFHFFTFLFFLIYFFFKIKKKSCFFGILKNDDPILGS